MSHTSVESLASKINRGRHSHDEEFQIPYIATDFNKHLEGVIDELFNVDLNVKSERVRLAGRHPMLDQRYAITTPEIEHFHDIAYDWSIARKSGLFVTGLHRQGKTTAIQSTIANLQEELPFIAFLRCNGQRLTIKTKEAFCRYLLDSWEYASAEIKRNARPEIVLANWIMVKCAERGGNQCVLLIDEAQLFSVAHYRYLLELWNALRSQGFILCTILVGQPDLKQLRAITDELDHGAVVARFFVKGYTMGGIKTQSMLGRFLRHYDSLLVYPAGSKWFYSRFFVKEAFDRGWRLESEAKNFWAALGAVSDAKPNEIKSSGFRLAWVVDTIHGFMLDAMAKDKPSFHGSAALWEELLQQSTDSKFVV